MESHLLQMRGLKPLLLLRSKALRLSHLLQMRGLKLVTMYAKVNNIGRIFYRCVD